MDNTRSIEHLDDSQIMQRINHLVQEEHELLNHGEEHGLSASNRQRLHEHQVVLDQLWDLLRQRRARRHAGLNPDEANVRPESVVENYRQ